MPEDIDEENYLALCGDIGCPFQHNYETFLRIHSNLYERIFIITGNHEYYTSKQYTIFQVEQRIRELTHYYPKVTFLNTNEPFQLGNTLFVGCALWSAVDETAESKMNDYKRIYIGEDNRYIATNVVKKKTWVREGRRPIRYMDVLEMHGKMLTYLEEMVNGDYSNMTTFAMKDTGFNTDTIEQLIMLTHHAPSFKMLKEKPTVPTPPIYDSEDSDDWDRPIPSINIDNCYATDCEYLFKKPVVCWISGHTHECKDEKINDIPCLSNCFGYPHQQTEFILKKCIEF
jgi:hypothetical protein